MHAVRRPRKGVTRGGPLVNRLRLRDIHPLRCALGNPRRTVKETRRRKQIQLRLTRLPSGARRDLLRVLASPSDVRAGLIRQMYERTATRDLAEVLMDLEADPSAQAVESELVHN